MGTLNMNSESATSKKLFSTKFAHVSYSFRYLFFVNEKYVTFKCLGRCEPGIYSDYITSCKEKYRWIMNGHNTYFLPHWSHDCVRLTLFWWLCLCFSRNVFDLQTLPQSSQVNFDAIKFLWWCICLLNASCRWNILKQISHLFNYLESGKCECFCMRLAHR